jgi:hypothetical protein
MAAEPSEVGGVNAIDSSWTPGVIESIVGAEGLPIMVTVVCEEETEL